MAGAPINLAKGACFAVAAALRHLSGVDPAVTAFPAATATNSVFPIMRHGQAVPDLFDIRASGGTPLAGTLWWFLQAMLPIKEQRKMIQVIGMPDNHLAANNAVRVPHKIGFEVYGLGIRDEHITHLLPQTSRVVNDLPDLVPCHVCPAASRLAQWRCCMMVPLNFRPWYRTGIFRSLTLNKKRRVPHC